MILSPRVNRQVKLVEISPAYFSTLGLVIPTFTANSDSIAGFSPVEYVLIQGAAKVLSHLHSSSLLGNRLADGDPVGVVRYPGTSPHYGPPGDFRSPPPVMNNWVRRERVANCPRGAAWSGKLAAADCGAWVRKSQCYLPSKQVGTNRLKINTAYCRQGLKPHLVTWGFHWRQK